MGTPVGGRLRVASPPLAKFVNPTIGIDGLYRYQNIYFIEGTQTGTHKFRRETSVGGNVWSDISLPGSYGAQAAVALVASSTCTGVFGPAVDGGKECLFLVDVRNAGPNLFKITDPATGATSRWGILPLASADVTASTAAVAGQNTKYINTSAADPMDSTNSDGSPEWALSTADETALSATTALSRVATPAVDGNALKVVIGKNDAAQIIRTFASDVDLTTFGAAGSTDEDYIQFYVRVRRPKNIENIEIAFDTTAAGDFKKDFFSRELTFKLVGRRKRKKLLGLGDLIPSRPGRENADTQQFLKDHADRLKDLSFAAEPGNQDIVLAKNTWTRVTLPKASFDQSGVPDWSKVRAIRFTVHANKQGSTAVFLDGLSLNGGVGLVGDYQYTFTVRNTATGTRSNPFLDSSGNVSKITVSNVEPQGVTPLSTA